MCSILRSATLLQLSWLILVVPIAAGCGETGGRGHIKGKVSALHPKTGKMSTVVWGTVTIWNEEKQQSVVASIAPDGTFEARNVHEGLCRILVSSPDPRPSESSAVNEDDEPLPAEVKKKWFPLSARYERLDATEIPNLTVTAGEQTLNIELKKAWSLREEEGAEGEGS